MHRVNPTMVSRLFRSAFLARTVAIILALMVALTNVMRSSAAETDIRVEQSTAEYSFGQHITFYLQAAAPTTITRVALYVRVQGELGVSLTEVPVEPGPRIFGSYLYSPSEQNLTPFATLAFWWEIQDAAGALMQTEEQFLYYADNRYPWQSLRDRHEGVSWDVYWVEGGAPFGEMVLDIAVEALDDVYRELRAAIPGSVRIFVYPSEPELRAALSLAGYEWAGGQARPELGAILVGISDGPAARGEMERLIPHELTHLLVYEAAGRTLETVPAWLNEGLATANERRPDPDRQALVEQALAQDRLIPLETLCAPFPIDQTAVHLAYAQSASVVSYLREEYGSQVIRDLLAAYADGARCEVGVTKVLHKSINGLDVAWRASLTRRGELLVALNESAGWLALWLLTALLVLPLLGVLRDPNIPRSPDIEKGGNE